MHALFFMILCAPLLAAATIACLPKSSHALSSFLSVTACLLSFIASIGLFFSPMEAEFPSFLWLSAPGLRIEIGGMNDALTRLMLLTVSGVGLLVQIFSCGYMKGDIGFRRYFAQMSFFMFSMLGIVLANNLVMLFMFWELVGLSSYWLIGFWFERPAAADAAKKAFIMNRLGDIGFMIGILLVWQIWGTLNFHELREAVDLHPYSNGFVTLTVLALFCGCIGKSAQFPLHTWLPDAMEGPTPVSALIHAATMVAAGVYMLCRISFLIQLSATAAAFIAVIGVITLLLAALIAIQQNDVKRILAYSTISQLGYMVMAVGLGAYAEAMFHLTTHAFFKALLFLAAGSVIHALNHQQDIWEMGGLFKRMKITLVSFCVGAMALTGVPFFSGFFSKESILLIAFHSNKIFFSLAILGVALTAFYMTRLTWIVFFRKQRAPSSIHESSVVMLFPLGILALLATAGGCFPMETYLHKIDIYESSYWPLACSLVAMMIGAGAAWKIYATSKSEPLKIPLLQNKFYFDEVYASIFVRVQDGLACIMSWIDQWIMEGVFVRIPSILTMGVGAVARLFQNGSLSTYVAIFLLGILAFFYWLTMGGGLP
ncbi:MAG: NADH-quinone oxidoreductase subunit L [Verrucomicrobiota bacterium]